MSDLLNTQQMAEFVAKGCLKFEGVVPEALNQRFLAEVGHVPEDQVTDLLAHYGRIMAASGIPLVDAGTPLMQAYPQGSALADIFALPRVRGIVDSLVGAACVLDHHFLHITFPKRLYDAAGQTHTAQHTHQDSTIDPRRAFDVQIMYFPHEVTIDMGGTRYLPGSHLRIVSEAAVARYQNVRGQQHVVCPAGSLLVLHHGIWHGGGLNRSERMRYMFKVRLCPTTPQVRLWDTADLVEGTQPRPIFWTGLRPPAADVRTVLTTREPWFEADTERLEYMNRIRLWRYLTGNAEYDVDYWMTRVENEH